MNHSEDASRDRHPTARQVTPIVKKRRPKKTSQIKVCDSLFGKIIRARGRCEHCATRSDLQCAHGFSRRYRAVRWDERNAFSLCRGCHLYFTMRPLEWDDWLHLQWGPDLYNGLRYLAMSGPNPALAEVAALLRERLREVEAA